METSCSALTVFFEAPFWVGLFERREDRRLTVCRIVFGAEPRDPEIAAFIQKEYAKLHFSPSVDAPLKPAAENPKRLQRQIARQLQQPALSTKAQAALKLQQPALSTKAQAALKLQQEQGKLARQERSREEKRAEAERRFALKQQQKKDRHRGR